MNRKIYLHFMRFDKLGMHTMLKGKGKDKGNWKEYNEQLVVGGMFYLDLEFVKNWNKELEEMNKGKRGGQYKEPEFIKWECVWKQLIDYRGLKAIARELTNLGLIHIYNDYTTIWYRVRNMVLEIKLPDEKEIEVATHGTGLKTDNAGEYRVFKYGKESKKKKHLVVIITADLKHKKLLKAEAHIEGEGESESKIAKKHMRELKREGKGLKNSMGIVYLIHTGF